MTLLRNSFAERVQQAANAFLASSVAAARLGEAAQQLADCRQANNPRSQWLPGMVAQQAMWAPDPCAEEENALAKLQEEAGGNQEVPAQNLGAAVAPQLAMEGDPTPNMDPAIPEQEFTVPEPGASNHWLEAMDTDEFIGGLLAHVRSPTDQEMEEIETIAEMVRVYRLWCPWGGPPVKNLKWKMKYRPKNIKWIGVWCP